jgi:signal transduction histidine kinase
MARERLTGAPAAGSDTADGLLPLLGAIRHELGNHLNSLKVALTVLNANLDRFPADKVHDYLSRSLAEIGRMETLFHSFRTLTTFSRPAFESVDLTVLLSDVCATAAPGLGKRGVELVHEIAVGRAAVRTDPRALRELLLALLASATEAALAANEPRVALAAHDGDGAVTVTVSDNGPSILEDRQRAGFRPFGDSAPKGAGIALVVVERLAALIGAPLKLASTPGIGTAVSVALPASEHTHERAVVPR